MLLDELDCLVFAVIPAVIAGYLGATLYLEGNLAAIESMQTPYMAVSSAGFITEATVNFLFAYNIYRTTG